MKPGKILSFVLLVFIILGGIMLSFPDEGFDLGGGYKIHFPSFREMFVIDTTSTPNISEIVKTNINIDSLEAQLSKLDSAGADSVIAANAEALIESVQRLEFGAKGKADLYRFFEKLPQAGKRVIRIMHYGDSQIEGDRITAFLRNKLQSRFGGSGPGLIPIVQAYDYSFSFISKASQNWKRYPGYGKKEEGMPHNGYGAMAAFSRYAPLFNDSLPNDSILYRASVLVRKSKSSYAKARKYHSCRLFYGNNQRPVHVVVKVDGNPVAQDTLPAGKGLRVSTWFLAPENSLELEFSGYDSPDVYGLALEDPSGISVDNIALRGSSGTIFTSMSSALLSATYASANVEMFILQFGGNVMPSITTDKQCKDYGNYFYNQLVALRRIRPEASIIVIGPSDMSYKDKDRYVTYPHLEMVNEALKEATLKSGGAYWDMFTAMGGKNSMPGWVSASPPLAAYDYVHFSTKGAQIIANMFYNAFIVEYSEYLKTITPESKSPKKKEGLKK